MPTYEFRCPMGHEFEQFYRSISGAPSEVACPTCGKKAERLISAGGGLVFKGSGFYITDYGKDGKKSQTAPPAGASDAGSGGAAESGGAKSDSKPTGESKPAGDSKSSGESKSSGQSKSSSESKSSGESKPRDPKPAAASKSAAKGSSGRAKSSE